MITCRVVWWIKVPDDIFLLFQYKSAFAWYKWNFMLCTILYYWFPEPDLSLLEGHSTSIASCQLSFQNILFFHWIYHTETSAWENNSNCGFSPCFESCCKHARLKWLQWRTCLFNNNFCHWMTTVQIFQKSCI